MKIFNVNGKKVVKKVELFTWEKLDYVDKIRSAFGLKNGSRKISKARAGLALA